MFKTKKYYKNQNDLLINELQICSEKISKLKRDSEEIKESYDLIKIKLSEREKELKKCISSDAKHQLEIINLKDQIKEYKKNKKQLEKENNELKSNKDLVKRIPSGRKPKGQTIGVKYSTKTSKIIKSVKEVEDE